MQRMRIKALMLSLALVMLSGCSLVSYLAHPVDHGSRSNLGSPTGKSVLIRLGQDDQICLPEGKQTVPVDIFVTLRGQPAGKVKFILNDTLKIELYGQNVDLHLQSVSIGPHHVDVYVNDEFQATKNWTVWACPPKPYRELYKPDGSGLKGYCEEKE